MNNSFEQINNEILPPNEKVRVVARLRDLGGTKYFLRTESGGYVWLDEDLKYGEAVDDVAIVSAITKHDYEPIEEDGLFEFGEREKVLGGEP